MLNYMFIPGTYVRRGVRFTCRWFKGHGLIIGFHTTAGVYSFRLGRK